MNPLSGNLIEYHFNKVFHSSTLFVQFNRIHNGSGKLTLMKLNSESQHGAQLSIELCHQRKLKNVNFSRAWSASFPGIIGRIIKLSKWQQNDNGTSLIVCHQLNVQLFVSTSSSAKRKALKCKFFNQNSHIANAPSLSIKLKPWTLTTFDGCDRKLKLF